MNRLEIHARAVLHDEEAGLLLDVASGKTLKLAAIQSTEELAGSLAVLLVDGRAFALTATGIAFAPLFANTGALDELPAAVSWKDFEARVKRLRQELYGPEGSFGLGTVRVLMCCLAIVDGARAAGFDVAQEELELEWHLKELERRAPSEK